MADVTIIPANVLFSTTDNHVKGVAGATIAAGDVLYRDAADSNKMKLSDANGSASAKVVDGFALCGAAAGQPVVYTTEDPALVVGGTLVSGTLYVLSATPGKICPHTDIGQANLP